MLLGFEIIATGAVAHFQGDVICLAGTCYATQTLAVFRNDVKQKGRDLLDNKKRRLIPGVASLNIPRCTVVARYRETDSVQTEVNFAV